VDQFLAANYPISSSTVLFFYLPQDNIPSLIYRHFDFPTLVTFYLPGISASSFFMMLNISAKHSVSFMTTGAGITTVLLVTIGFFLRRRKRLDLPIAEGGKVNGSYTPMIMAGKAQVIIKTDIRYKF
jgi:hypothetical protein